jgi:hypothetical protein
VRSYTRIQGDLSILARFRTPYERNENATEGRKRPSRPSEYCIGVLMRELRKTTKTHGSCFLEKTVNRNISSKKYQSAIRRPFYKQLRIMFQSFP